MIAEGPILFKIIAPGRVVLFLLHRVCDELALHYLYKFKPSILRLFILSSLSLTDLDHLLPLLLHVITCITGKLGQRN